MSSLLFTACFTPFRVNPRPAGDFAVDRFNSATGNKERWDVFEEQEDAVRACRQANRLLARAQKKGGAL